MHSMLDSFTPLTSYLLQISSSNTATSSVMGGSAFARTVGHSGKPIKTPRMSPEVYHEIARYCQTKLETLFERVSIPREAPGKADFGDVDFIVEGPRSVAATGGMWTAVEEALGAEARLHNGGSHSYAIPHPAMPEAHVQVDVELLSEKGAAGSIGLFQWTLFMKGDSDLTQIIGISHHSLGLCCNDRGLHIRVAEIECYNKKDASLFLTRDPYKAMEFYGFDISKYQDGFAEETHLFDWASSGRFFRRDVLDHRVEKASERSRRAKRPMYRRFVEDYVPTRLDEGTATALTRQEVLEEALDFFDKHAEYKAMMTAHRLKEAEEELWTGIRTRLPVGGNSLATTLKALRRWVMFQEGKPCIATELQEYANWTSLMAVDSSSAVLDWVMENWREAKALEKARASAAKKTATTM